MKKYITNPFYILAFVVACSTGQLSAQTFEPPVIIDPPNPMVGDTIRVGLFETFHFPCLILPMDNLDGETHLFDFDNSIPNFPENHIDLIVVTLDIPICVPFPVTPAPREFYELGTLAEGDYSLRTGLIGPVSQFPLPPGILPFQYGEILTFSVASPQPISSTSTFSLIALFILILIVTFLLHKKMEANNP